MLSVEDNKRLTETGPGTPAGELFRRYWQPACLSREIPEKDGAPVRVRLLGEDLIAFRDTDGKVGLVDAYCPHRRAPMFFGRNEECGLRCVYHGWKFDVTGKCLETPNEPADSKMKDHITIKAYPAVDRAGIIWAYLGPKETMPEPPDYEWMRAPQTHRQVSKTFEACNYLQALEGGLDTAHSSFLHNNDLKEKRELRQRDKAPNLDVERTDWGYYYVSTRKMGDEGAYVRVYQYAMPAQQMRGGVTNFRGRNETPALHGHLWVPIDDTKTNVYNLMYTIDPAIPMTAEEFEHHESYAGRGKSDIIPGSFVLKKNPSNDYLIDRNIQKHNNFTGIIGVNTQDFALQESMGGADGRPICDRSQEHLGSSDKAIIAMRNLLLEAVNDVEQGKAPRGSTPVSQRQMRAFDKVIPPNSDWKKEFADDLRVKW